MSVTACVNGAGSARDYWRNPGYNLTRTIVLAVLAFIFGVIFFKIGTTGTLYIAALMRACGHILWESWAVVGELWQGGPARLFLAYHFM